MSLYSDWKAMAENERSQQENEKFWKEYFDAETENYKALLSNYKETFTGTVAELATRFNMEQPVFLGFLDGINTSLKAELDLESLTAESTVALDIDLEKLYYNMLDAKATWLYGLPEWDAILTQEKRHEITKEFRAAGIFVNTETVGRNDPCPCGSGKKYKKCCGK